MKYPSKLSKHEFYNLYQRLKMGNILTTEDLGKFPPDPGVYAFWLDEAPPLCLFVGMASPKLENGLREILETEFQSDDRTSEFARKLAGNTRLGRTYKFNLRRKEGRQNFLREHVYVQILPLTGMREDDLQSFKDFLEFESDLSPVLTGKSKTSRR
jgi:hypothetical protein